MPNDWIGYDEAELERIGIICAGCGTEAIFDLKKDHTANASHNCPGCDQELLESFTRESTSHYNWVTYYQMGRNAKKNPAIRFYFRRSTP